jgi:hypothetical protein
LAVRGYAIEVPGAREDVQSLQAKYGVRLIEGTSDMINGPEQEKLVRNARAYAELYNQTILTEKPEWLRWCRLLPKSH